MAHINRKEYFFVFIALTVLTAIEVGIVFVPGISNAAMIAALVGLAVAKALCVAWYFMHLNHETRYMRLSVLIPMSIPAVYALVLIAEAGWRLL